MLRDDLRELILKVEVIERSHKADRVLSRDLDDLRANFGRMRGTTDKLAQE